MWPFRRARVTEHVTNADVMKRLIDMEAKLAHVEAQHISLRGRVYALWGKGGTEKPEVPTDLNDPRLTKAQVKAALIARGALKPRSDTN
jgi:hypothetical protein